MRLSGILIALTLFAVLAVPLGLAAQDETAQAKTAQHHHYKLIDMGTFEGPNGYLSALLDGYNSANVMNGAGNVVGWGDTSAPDPFPGSCFDLGDCFVAHAFRFKNGSLSDLGSLAEGWSSAATWINQTGEIVGVSQNGVIDPVAGFPERRAVVWRDGNLIDLGTLGGNQSAASNVNDRGQIAGLALNSIPDPFSIYDVLILGSPNGTQTRAVLWDKSGRAQDLGTLGGPDAFAVLVNQRGQVTGWSYTNSIPNATTGLPTFHPYLWVEGKGMRDLGTLGGTIAQAVNGLNDRGEVVGSTTMAGDQTHHPFLWDGTQLVDLGTLGGDNGEADWVNNAGEVVGIAQPTGVTGQCGGHAFLWRHGVLKDLGTTAGLNHSEGVYINTKAQVVGYSFNCGSAAISAFLWENGSIVDLNTLTLSNQLYLLSAVFVADSGEIAAFGLLLNGDSHAALLIPCDDDHPAVEGCDYSMVDAARPSGDTPATHAPQSTQLSKEAIARIISASRNPFMRRHRLPGQRPTPSN